jgi:uncharacterized protein
MLHLQKLAKLNEISCDLSLSERVPEFIATPCQLHVDYHVEAKDDFYLIYLTASGELIITCQRCMNDFNTAYNNSTVIAVARSEQRAEQLLEHYECIVSSNWQVNLDDIVIDELYLYAPQFHKETTDCDHQINHILTSKD